MFIQTERKDIIAAKRNSPSWASSLPLPLPPPFDTDPHSMPVRSKHSVVTYNALRQAPCWKYVYQGDRESGREREREEGSTPAEAAQEQAMENKTKRVRNHRDPSVRAEGRDGGGVVVRAVMWMRCGQLLGGRAGEVGEEERMRYLKIKP